VVHKQISFYQPLHLPQVEEEVGGVGETEGNRTGLSLQDAELSGGEGQGLQQRVLLP